MVTRIPLRRHEDERGWFMELMRARREGRLLRHEPL